jgi:hypothetical protein
LCTQAPRIQARTPRQLASWWQIDLSGVNGLILSVETASDLGFTR